MNNLLEIIWKLLLDSLSQQQTFLDGTRNANRHIFFEQLPNYVKFDVFDPITDFRGSCLKSFESERRLLLYLLSQRQTLLNGTSSSNVEENI